MSAAVEILSGPCAMARLGGAMSFVLILSSVVWASRRVVLL